MWLHSLAPLWTAIVIVCFCVSDGRKVNNQKKKNGITELIVVRSSEANCGSYTYIICHCSRSTEAGSFERCAPERRLSQNELKERKL